MKKRYVWHIASVFGLPMLALLLMTVAFWLWSPTAFLIVLPFTMAICVYGVWNILHTKRRVRTILKAVANQLGQARGYALDAFPMAVAAVTHNGEIIWHNSHFTQSVWCDGDANGESIARVVGDMSVADMVRKSTFEVSFKNRYHMVYAYPLKEKGEEFVVLYFTDTTALKLTALEYARTRPILLLIYIDNLEELTQNSRNSERAQLSGRVETMLEDWVTSGNGILQKYDDNRFLAVVDTQYYDTIVASAFDILERVRKLDVGQQAPITLSIGVGRGDTFRAAETAARQSLDMALGRGGDQAAERTDNGYTFYGGLSKGVEKRNKVRTRIVASALCELMRGSDNVLVMGHRYSDLDCLGSACALVSLARSMGKEAYVVVNAAQSLANELIRRYTQAGHSDWFLAPDAALHRIREKTLLIITDTQNPTTVESLDVYHRAPQVAVIDHHRKTVSHIDNALLFYHEPYASSAAEMVAEMVPYFTKSEITRLDAEALLAGIMLDTRSFVMKAGVRTFEAAAFLKKVGADTVEVKRMFSGSMDVYRLKSDIISTAYMYKNKAIATHTKGGTEIRVAAAQAADELLSIQGVDASFALFPENGGVNISARSMGDFNVQLTMEALGGGGHLNMAGAFLVDTTIEQAQDKLKSVLDEQIKTMQTTLSGQGIGYENTP